MSESEGPKCPGCDGPLRRGEVCSDCAPTLREHRRVLKAAARELARMFSGKLGEVHGTGTLYRARRT